MKRIITLGIIIGFLTNCHTAQKEYIFEKKILNCFYQEYNQAGIDIKKSIDSAAQVLVKHQVLNDQTGESDIELIEAINQKDDLPFEPSSELIKELKKIKHLPAGIQCPDVSIINFDSTELASSKFRYLMQIYDSIQNKDHISPKVIAGEILKYFDKDDFNNEFFKTLGTLTLASFVKSKDYDGMFSITAPLMKKSKPHDEEKFTTLTLSLTSGDELKVDNMVVSLDSALKKIEDFILKHKEKHLIIINSSRSTKYELYATVVKELDVIYEVVRNKYANQKFNANYLNLNEKLKKQIEIEIPKNISVSEPTYN